jgi:hypothetical protein
LRAHDQGADKRGNLSGRLGQARRLGGEQALDPLERNIEQLNFGESRNDFDVAAKPMFELGQL